MSEGARPLQPLLRRGPVEIDLAEAAKPGAGQDLVIAFSSIGHDPSRPPSPEFVATAIGKGGSSPRRALFVRDGSRSWASAPDFAPALREAVAQLAARAPIGRTLALGQSMGGFAALAAARVVPVDVVLAFGPQYAPQDPSELRWSEWTARIRQTPFPTAPLLAPGRPGPWVCLFHGLADDRAQALAFPVLPGVDHFFYDGIGHSALVGRFKTRGLFSGLAEAALAGDRRRLIRLAVSAGGVRRRMRSEGQAKPKGPA